MSDNTPITVTHGVVENDLPHVIHSYRWARDGMTITLNVRVDEMQMGDSVTGSINAEGAKVMNHKVGFNPEAVRERIDQQHWLSDDYEEPPQAINKYKRQRERELEKNREMVQEIREKRRKKSFFEKAKERLQR